MTKPTSHVCKFFMDYIITSTKNKLNNLFSTNTFDLNNRTLLLSIPYNTIIYEQPDTKKIYIGEPDDSSDEYIVYTINRIDTLIDISANLEKTKEDLYNLVIVFELNNQNYEIVYDPNKTIPSILKSFKTNNLPMELMQEYINVAHRFSGMSFHNHANIMALLYEVPKLTLSINGSIFNRPDLEYYIVFGEGYNRYTVQVYKLKSNGRRDEMLFGVWIDAKTKQVYEPYIIKLLDKKFT